jgi:phosphoribosylformylglycinamidine synthase
VPAAPHRFCIRVSPRTPALDGHGRDALADIHILGRAHIEAVRSGRLYFLEGALDEADARRLAAELFADPVAETASVTAGFSQRTSEHPAIEIHPLPGVMDPVALTALEAARRLLGQRADRVTAVRTGRRYEVIGARTAEELATIATRVLANTGIEAVFVQGLGRTDKLPESFPTPPDKGFTLRTVTLRGLSDDELAKLSRQAHLFLSLEEMHAVRDHFAKLDRDPTDLELETLAQTWSEHCVHKTLKSAVEYEGDDFGKPGQVKVRFDNLLADTIAKATRTLNRDWCLSVFVDNAGVVAFDDEWGIAFKCETHNHPSAIEPYGGSATGVGGCIRDVMGCGLGAKPIASTDVFCLAPPDYPDDRLPEGVLHPRRMLKGVVRGVRDYGNRMGIPTVNGAIYFDRRYLANPLVFCGCVGLIPRKFIDKAPRTGDRIVVAGGRTGRDGIHGATFSSAELTDTHADEFSHAVQIGNALVQKKVLDAQLRARDAEGGCLYSSVTDCGAGGLSSAVGEMGEKLGAVVDLETVPLKYAGLRYDEIWISEAQERMVFAVPPERLDAFLRIFAEEDVEATVIGTFADDGVLTVRYRGTVVGQLDMEFLHHGLPKTVRKATWSAAKDSDDVGRERAAEQHRYASWMSESPRPFAENERLSLAARLTVAGELKRARTRDVGYLTPKLIELLGSLNIASKEWVIRQYDHEVQGRSVVKPLTGIGSGPSDAAVLRPLYDQSAAIAIGCGMCPSMADTDPYEMAVAAVDEALRNVICVGANPDRVAILDNFCWGKVDSAVAMGALVRACKGATDAAIAYGLPFISGKDSLNNEFTQNAADAARLGLPERITIPGTLMISALGHIADVSRVTTMDLKSPGHVLALVGPCRIVAGDLSTLKLGHHAVAKWIDEGKICAAHDISDGGLAVAVAEMCIASNLGATINLDWFHQQDRPPLQRRPDGSMDESLARELDGPFLGDSNTDAKLETQELTRKWLEGERDPAVLFDPERLRDSKKRASYPASIFTPVLGSYVVEMPADVAKALDLTVIGRVEAQPVLNLYRWDMNLIRAEVADLAAAWRAPLADGGAHR